MRTKKELNKHNPRRKGCAPPRFRRRRRCHYRLAQSLVAAARGAWWSVSRSPPQPAASRRPSPRLSPAAANAAAATPVKSVGELDGDDMADAIRDVDIARANAEGGGGRADRKGVGQVNPIAATAAATTIAAADAAAGA